MTRVPDESLESAKGGVCRFQDGPDPVTVIYREPIQDDPDPVGIIVDDGAPI